MSDFTASSEDEVAAALFGNTDMTGKANLYVGAHTSDPGNSPDGSTEVGATDYDRVQTAPGDWSVSGNGPKTATNDVDVEFAEAQNDWGTITHITVWDDTEGASGETAYTKYALDSSVDINAGDILRFPANDITFDID